LLLAKRIDELAEQMQVSAGLSQISARTKGQASRSQ
jgi:hypothetical protein